MGEPIASTRFRYRASPPGSGAPTQGEMSANDAFAVRNRLRDAGWEVEAVEALGPALRMPATIRSAWTRWRRSRRSEQRADLADALASLLSAGVPLERALADLADSAVRSADERMLLRELRDGIRAGETLEACADRRPDWFDGMDTALLSIGRRTGELARVLQDISDSRRQAAEIGHKMSMALTYPAVLLVVALGVVSFLGTSTLPALVSILQNARIEPPLLTHMMIAIGYALAWWWWALAAAAVLLGWFARRAVRRIPPDSAIRRWYSLSALGRARQRMRGAAIASALARLVRNGIPLPDALDVASRAVSSLQTGDLLRESAQEVRQGGRLSQALGRSPLLDPEFSRLLSVSEQAGDLPRILERLAERYDRASRRSIERFSMLVEPLAILGMAVLVGTVVMAAILPLIALGDIL